jgi:hypothetical protein
METHGICLRDACFDMTMARDRFKTVYTWELEVNGARGGLIIHGVILKMEMDSEDSAHANGGATL